MCDAFLFVDPKGGWVGKGANGRHTLARRTRAFCEFRGVLRGIGDLVRRPGWIDKDAQKLWKRVAGNVPQGTVIDEELLGVFVQSLAEYQWAVGTLAAEGRVISTTNGYKTPHPAVAIANKAVVNILKFARLYKMETAQVGTQSGMEKFLFGPDDGSDE